MKDARVRARTVRRWDDGQGVYVSRVYGYQARTVDEAVGKVHGSYQEASWDAQAYNRSLREKSPSAVETA